MPWQAKLPFGSPSNDRPLASDETSRRVALGDRIVPYVLRRAKRRTIGLSIDHRGLRVNAPGRASLQEIEALIMRHSEWVAQKLDEWRGRRQPEVLKLVDGTRLPLLGGSLELRLALGNNRFLWNEQNSSSVLTLCLRAPQDAPRVLEKALRERALRFFSERLEYFSDQMSVQVPPLTLSAARTRWGSCSLRSGIRLNWRLIHFPGHVIDYVVVHELAHLREMNHSPSFWAIVGQICPEHRRIRGELKTLANHCPHW